MVRRPCIEPSKVFFFAILTALKKFRITYLYRNPVLFVLFVSGVSALSISLTNNIQNPVDGITNLDEIFITSWIFLTIFIANFAESLAEVNGKYQANLLKQDREKTVVKKINSLDTEEYTEVGVEDLSPGDLIFLTAGDMVPSDGIVLKGVALVNESAITGESAPVIREEKEERNVVTAGTRLLSDRLIVRVTSKRGDAFIDRMIRLVDGVKRYKSDSELSLGIFLCLGTLSALIMVAMVIPLANFTINSTGVGQPLELVVVIAFAVCLIPTTLGGLVSAIAISSMDKLIKKNIIATSSQCLELASASNIILIDKTGTITFGNRHAIDLIVLEPDKQEELIKACYYSSIYDSTIEGRSVISFINKYYSRDFKELEDPSLEFKIIPFTAEAKTSGLVIRDETYLKGSFNQVFERSNKHNAHLYLRMLQIIGNKGNTPLLVAKNQELLGIIELKDEVKPNIKQKILHLRDIGIRTVMLTGDNQRTASTIAIDAGVEDFIADITPEKKLELIKKLQSQGKIVAMIGDGINDVPALAQANIGICMNQGTEEAKRVSNIVDLDSDPSKIIDVINISKEMLITRGALATFNLFSDVAKYFVIIPAAFTSICPSLSWMNVLQLSSPASAIKSAIVFNALIIIVLMPLALKGIKFDKRSSINKLFLKHYIFYGLGGLIAPLVGIKLLDILLNL